MISNDELTLKQRQRVGEVASTNKHVMILKTERNAVQIAGLFVQ